MEPALHPVKPPVSSPHCIRHKAVSPTNVLSAASPRNLPKRPLSPRVFQEKTSHAINAAIALPKEVAGVSNKPVIDNKKFLRPPTGMNRKPVPTKVPKLTHWLNVGTVDMKARTNTKIKLQEPVSPSANKPKNFFVQNNENKFRLPRPEEGKSARNQNAFITGGKAGNYVSPRCISKKHEGIKLNTSANLMTGNTITDYQIARQIGQGAYAVVKEATYRTTNNKVAIKVYDKFKLLDPQRKKSVNREIQILQKLSHPNIVKLYETIDSIKQLYLVMEYVKGRSLYTYLKSKDGRRLPENEARRIFKQVLMGIQYCHKRNVSHRDIKLENILLTDQHEIKIIDFGFSTCYPPGTKLRVFCGTPSYMAPEIVTKKDYYGAPADMWALGVLLFAMLSGRFPFKGGNDRELYRNIAKGEFVFSSSTSAKARALIKKLLQVDPNKRPTCDEVLKDSFMAQNGESPPKSIIDFSKYNQEAIQKIVYFCSSSKMIDKERV